MFCAKIRLRKHQILEKLDDFEKRPSCKGYSLCKIVSLGQRLKLKKDAKNDSLIILDLFCAKNRLSKHQILEKSDDFEKRPSSKGYSLCKVVSFGEILKFKKTCQKRFFNHFRLLLYKKSLRKHQIFQKWDDFEKRPSCKGYSLCKIVTLGQRLKLKKTWEKRFVNHIRVVLCKKPLEKTPNIREMRRFWKTGIMQRL